MRAGINEACITVMLLNSQETAQVQEAFRNIKDSMDVLVDKSCTLGTIDDTCVKEADKQYFRGRFRECLGLKEAFNGLEDTGKLKYYGWAWYAKTWDEVMKLLREGYVKMDWLIRSNQHLEEVAEVELEMFIGKYNICVAHMHEYKRIWTEEILPRQKEQSNAWKASPLMPASLNPYGVRAKFAALKAL
jgi:hypothetical protein